MSDSTFREAFALRSRSGSRPHSYSVAKLSGGWPPAGSSSDAGIKSTSRVFAPVTTAAAWAIHDANTGDLLWEKRSDEKREMASLTKIMTCLLTTELLTRFEQEPEDIKFKVTRLAARICGTHSGLRENEEVSVLDLMYALMLPSGNDAALTLAIGFGEMLLKSKNSRVMSRFPMDPVQAFVKEMNKLAQKLNLKNTSYTNPHGLSEKGNKSTVFDLGKLGFHAMNNVLIQKIASTQVYEAEIVDGKGNTRKLVWRNTNKLLEKGFLGLKTGTTPNAGLCLSSVLRQGENGVIVTLLNAKSETHRWGESEKLARWGLSNILFVRGKIESASETGRVKIGSRLLTEIARNSQ